MSGDLVHILKAQEARRGRVLHFPLSTPGDIRKNSRVTLPQAIERLYDLNVGITPLEEGAPHERPHKPLLLLAAFDLIDEGKATPDRIPWCQERNFAV